MDKKNLIKIVFYFKQFLQFIMVIITLSIIVFFMARLSPGDPLQSYYGEGAERMTTEEKSDAMERLGLNKPVPKQYIHWLNGALKGNFGISYKYKQDVVKVIDAVFINTAILGGGAFVITFALALFLGVYCAKNEDTMLDRIICKIGTISSVIPSFWISLVLILIFSINLKILPSSGAYSTGMSDNIISRMVHLILPMCVMVLGHLWYYTYMVRNRMIEELRQDYVTLCEAKGLSRNIIVYRHCLRNIMPTFISIMAISVPHIIGGTYVVEQVFSYPGLGTLSFESARFHDYNMLMVICLLTGVIVAFANLLAQSINNFIDPRMRLARRDEE